MSQGSLSAVGDNAKPCAVENPNVAVTGLDHLLVAETAKCLVHRLTAHTEKSCDRRLREVDLAMVVRLLEQEV
ncbi:MAG: hypothetical protein DWQ40_01070 [Actinobacteria bacterium]|nr:MAG: hypothetical protein DWQ40_01070 [Actinomycetota bacterium]REK39136.1 MAG: hypothetical protein DWQ20_03065 [Actinomycetota bacterium]